jgi:ubiquilin
MKVQIRGSQGVNFQVEIGDSATILDLKNSIAKTRSLDAASIRLIYSGKILADDKELSFYGITEGHTIHMVVSGNRAAPKPAPAPAPAAAPTATAQAPSPQVPSDPLPQFTPPPQPNPFAGLGGLGGMPNMEQIRAMMQNPMVQNMMNEVLENPEMLRQMMQANPMFANNPMMQQMVDQIAANPEMVRSMMNAMYGVGSDGAAGTPSSDVFSQMMQNPEVQRMMNDPAAVQEVMNAMGGLYGQPGAAANPFGALFGQPAAAPFTAPQPTSTTATPAATANKATFYKITGMAETPELNTKLDNPRAASAVRQLIDACRNLRREGINVFPTVDALDTPPPTPAPAPAPPAPVPQPTISNEERFASQLQIMNEMGLNDNTKNIRALLASNGNVTVAIERIFAGNFD